MSIGSYFEFPRHQDKVIDKIYIRLEHKLSMTKNVKYTLFNYKYDF